MRCTVQLLQWQHLYCWSSFTVLIHTCQLWICTFMKFFLLIYAGDQHTLSLSWTSLNHDVSFLLRRIWSLCSNPVPWLYLLIPLYTLMSFHVLCNVSYSDFHQKQAAKKALMRKALDKNPDEFYFKMIRTRMEVNLVFYLSLTYIYVYSTIVDWFHTAEKQLTWSLFSAEFYTLHNLAYVLYVKLKF